MAFHMTTQDPLFTGNSLTSEDREALARLNPDLIRHPGITEEGKVGPPPVTFIFLANGHKLHWERGEGSSHAGLQIDRPEIDQIGFALRPDLQEALENTPQDARQLLDQVGITGRIGYHQYANKQTFHTIALWESPLLRELLRPFLMQGKQELGIQPHFVVVSFQQQPMTVAEILEL